MNIDTLRFLLPRNSTGWSSVEPVCQFLWDKFLRELEILLTGGCYEDIETQKANKLEQYLG